MIWEIQRQLGVRAPRPRLRSCDALLQDEWYGFPAFVAWLVIPGFTQKQRGIHHVGHELAHALAAGSFFFLTFGARILR